MRLLAPLILLAACASPRPAPSATAPGSPPAVAPAGAAGTAAPASGAREAAAGVTDRALADLLTRAWEWRLATEPVFATTVGDHRYDDRIEDVSEAAWARNRRTARALLDEARALDPARLGADDRTTLGLFVSDLERFVAEEVCQAETWMVSVAFDNPVNEFGSLADEHVVKSVADGRNLVARYRAIPKWIDDHVSNLRRGLAAGRVANAGNVRRVVDVIDRQLGLPTVKWRLMETARAERPGWSPADATAVRRDLAAAIDEGIRPALARYRAVLRDELLPRARDDARAGVWALPGGTACYEARIAGYTTTTRTANELHELGRREIARINAEMRALGRRLFGTRNLRKILARLRTDRRLYFDTAEAVEAKATAALAAANAAVPRWFGRLPKATCTVRRVPAVDAPFQTIAYYEAPNADGSKPGFYYVNTHEPGTRPRYEAEALAFHESVPGHHLQIAIAQELPEVPAFRRHGRFTAFIEGWGLYAERLAADMGLYGGDLDHMGRLSFEAWRAARLVVDTGIHAKRWSREQAVAYMLAHTALAENNIRNEVDRYIALPGQALAYKVGQLEILRLREEARAALGARFDVRSFHDVVLGGGAVTLPVLEERVRAWIATAKGGAASPAGT